MLTVKKSLAMILALFCLAFAAQAEETSIVIPLSDTFSRVANLRGGPRGLLVCGTDMDGKPLAMLYGPDGARLSAFGNASGDDDYYAAAMLADGTLIALRRADDPLYALDIFSEGKLARTLTQSRQWRAVAAGKERFVASIANQGKTDLICFDAQGRQLWTHTIAAGAMLTGFLDGERDIVMGTLDATGEMFLLEISLGGRARDLLNGVRGGDVLGCAGADGPAFIIRSLHGKTSSFIALGENGRPHFQKELVPDTFTGGSPYGLISAACGNPFVLEALPAGYAAAARLKYPCQSGLMLYLFDENGEIAARDAHFFPELSFVQQAGLAAEDGGVCLAALGEEADPAPLDDCQRRFCLVLHRVPTGV